MSDRLLVLVRHGQSEWNLKNLFTGWKDPDLSEQGVAEAKEAGRKLKAQGQSFDIAFTSVLTRAQHTLDLMLAEIGQTGLKTTRDLALNERDYGDLSGLNKDDARKKWGEDQVLIWRRSYDVPPPGGESLKDTLARVLPYWERRIAPDRVVAIGTQVCRALSAAHAAGIIHRDLKPENIFLVSREGVPDFVKVLDFGIAKQDMGNQNSPRRLTTPGIAMGTPEYMAPEQARGEKRLDARADVFSLGCVLFKCLTGRSAFIGDDVNDLPALRIAGVSVAPQNAQPEVKRAASLILDRSGGRGAIRELVELILAARSGAAGWAAP